MNCRLALVLLSNSVLSASVAIQGAGGLTVTLAANGQYTISTLSPAWTFSGVAGGAISNVLTGSGSDGAGNFNQISFNYLHNAAARSASIRAYTNKQVVIFSVTYQAAATNNGFFPSFSAYPSIPYHLTYQGLFAAPSFTKLLTDSPWVLFDGSGNTCVISAASHFLQGYVGYDTRQNLNAGIDPTLKSIPAGFVQQTALVIGTGIDATIRTWGQTLTSLAGKVPAPNDQNPALNTLGYWTDHYGAYFYQTDSSGSYEQTMFDVKADLAARGVPVGYFEIDGWFYPKGAADIWSAKKSGIYLYQADSVLFPDGFPHFQASLGFPLVAQAKWIDPSSPYFGQYTLSGGVATDPAYWNAAASYLASAGVRLFEQDFLGSKAQPLYNLTDPDLFLNSMAAGMASQNIDVQYCMPLARHFLQSVNYGNVVSIRCSQDGFSPATRTPFVFTSTLASALGLWPFTDVVSSSWTGGLLYSVLSAGPVGFGDAVGTETTGNLSLAARADGVLVRPDLPIAPLDMTYLSSAMNLDTPIVAAAYTDFGGFRPYYVYAYPNVTNVSLNVPLSALGMSGSAYVFNPRASVGTVVPAGGAITDQILGDFNYYVVSPIGPSGIAVLGDLGNFVPLGKKRIPTLSDKGAVQLTIAFAPQETERILSGYAPAMPTVSAVSGTVGSLTYNAHTGLFSIVVSPGANGAAALVVSPGA